MESTKPDEGPGQETGRLVFSTYGHVLGLADGVLFGAKRPPRQQGTAASPGKAPAADPVRDPGHSPHGDAPRG